MNGAAPASGEPAARPDAAHERAAGPLVLYDGLCGLCNRFVQFVLRWDRRGRVQFATLQGRHGQDARRRFPALRTADSVALLMDGRALIKSDAVLATLCEMGAWWPAAHLLRVVPGSVGDRVYDLMARSRYAWFGRYPACPIPTADQQRRFLDPPGAD
jgi:predicted DCC family thiol-disulfide oxidoreductase YuxK